MNIFDGTATMATLDTYFRNLIERVEGSDEISNLGRDAEGFFKPTRTILLRHLNLLKDLNQKPLAKQMLKTSWEYVAEQLPPEWLEATDEERLALGKMLGREPSNLR